jgi:hypothetical protein
MKHQETPTKRMARLSFSEDPPTRITKHTERCTGHDHERITPVSVSSVSTSSTRGRPDKSTSDVRKQSESGVLPHTAPRQLHERS